jgi:hypothetical protein
MASCDIAESACLESVLELTACLRGDDTPPLPQIRRITRDEYAAEVKRDAEDAGRGGSSPLDAVLASLHLQPQNRTTIDSALEAFSESVAFYDSDAKRVTLISDAQSENPLERIDVLSHELTHYLQDLEFDLNALAGGAPENIDGHTAMRALIEGEAVVTGARVRRRLEGRSAESFDWEAWLQARYTAVSASIVESRVPLWAALHDLPYEVGARYVSQLWLTRGRSEVDALFDAPPRQLGAWLEGAGASPSPLACAPPLPTDGFKLYSFERFGAAGVFALLAAAGRPDLALAARLDDDAFAVYLRGSAGDLTSARAIGLWRLRFASESDADHFLAAISVLALEQSKFGREIVIRASPDREQTGLRGDVLATCPSLDDLRAKGEGAPITDSAFGASRTLQYRAVRHIR